MIFVEVEDDSFRANDPELFLSTSGTNDSSLPQLNSPLLVTESILSSDCDDIDRRGVNGNGLDRKTSSPSF